MMVALALLDSSEADEVSSYAVYYDSTRKTGSQTGERAQLR